MGRLLRIYARFYITIKKVTNYASDILKKNLEFLTFFL